MCAFSSLGAGAAAGCRCCVHLGACVQGAAAVCAWELGCCLGAWVLEAVGCRCRCSVLLVLPEKSIGLCWPNFESLPFLFVALLEQGAHFALPTLLQATYMVWQRCLGLNVRHVLMTAQEVLTESSSS